MTHVAWVPPEWEPAAREVLEGLDDRHPSRTIMLLPDPSSERDALDADVDVRCFGKGGVEGTIASEVLVLRLLGRRAAAPASIVQPLLVSDLPAFLRWRGDLPFGSAELEQLVAVVDRLVVDGSEWRDPDTAYRYLPTLFERVAVSDIAWSRLRPWREAIAALWPDVAEADAVEVVGPRAQALLLAWWLSSRLGRNVRLEHESKGEIEHVEVDGREVRPALVDRPTTSDLLSAELEQFGRDPVYEEAVWSSTSKAISPA
jgi:glucose-6-phosphate dehydrogenase assembly protein OpcA